MAAAEINNKKLETSPQWSNLQPELLSLISTKLATISNLVRFRGVCRSWRSAAKSTRLPPQIPLLILPNAYLENENGYVSRSFLNPSTGEVRTVHLPAEFMNFAICGTSNGWLVMINRNLNAVLLNPITRSKIQLPSTAGTFQRILDLRPGQILRLTQRVMIDFHCYASIASYDKKMNESVVIFTNPKSQWFVYCKLGDAQWTEVYAAMSDISSIVYYKGKFYAMDHRGQVGVGDSGSKFEYIPSLNMPSYGHLMVWEEDLLMAKLYNGMTRMIVQEGGLWSLKPCNEMTRTSGFGIFKLDVSEDVLRWQELKGIGNLNVFFQSMFPCSSFASDALGCKGNRVYSSVAPNLGDSKERLTAYNIEDETTEILPCYHDAGLRAYGDECIWFEPRLC